MTTNAVTSFAMPVLRLSVWRDLFSLTKPRLSSLVVFTCALGLFLAPGSIALSSAFIAIAATSALVGGACIINCVMEKDIDAKMERTKNRPLPSGRLSSDLALVVGVALISVSLGTLYFMTNELTALLGFVAMAAYVFFYTPLKQKTPLALFAGAIPGALPPLMGWTSVTNSIGALGVVLFAILFVWQLPHFLSIAIYHNDDYKKANLKTHPGHIGIRASLHRIAVYTLILMLISLVPYWLGEASVTYRNLVFVLGAGFLILSLMGHSLKEGSQELMQWARQYFYASIIYLPCVFVLMLLFRQ